MIKYIFITIFIFFTIKAIANQTITTGFNYALQSPPKNQDLQGMYQYLYTIYQQWMTGQVTTTYPTGVIDSKYGTIAIYFDGTNYWLMTQTSKPNGTAWVGTKLGAI